MSNSDGALRLLRDGGEPAPATLAAEWREQLARLELGHLTDAERIDGLHHLERLKGAIAAAQARITADFEHSQRQSAPPRKSAAEVSRAIGAQVALARQDSPARGNRHLGLALALVREMPHTLARLTSGELSEWRATLVVQATATLSAEDRRTVDAELSDHDLHGLGDRRIGDLARGIADRLDPAAAVRRRQHAASERRVGLRPAPDTMARLSALLPVADAVAATAALQRHAQSVHATGDSRTVAQIMADTLVDRVTGRTAGASADVEVQLVMSPESLLDGANESAYLHGYGSVPARLARDLVRSADKAWVRRLFTCPDDGTLVQAESRRRVFTGRLRDLIVWRDRTCRTPWCDAPIRHVDHVRPWAESRRTHLDEGQGLCEGCNLAKDTHWRTDVSLGRGHVVELRTATGHRYRSKAPAQPGTTPLEPHYRGLRRRLGRPLDDTG